MRLSSVQKMVVVLGLGLAGSAAADSYKIDPAHSNVNFEIQHLLSKTSGRFKDFSGSFDFDKAKKTGGNIDVKIASTSIDTANDKRDEHLRSGDFFDVKTHPELTFKSKKVTTDGKTFTAEGDLTMRGVTKPATLKGEFMGEMKDMQGALKAGFKATTKVNRKDYGITWNKSLDTGGFVLGDDVEIELLVEAENQTAGKKQATN